jgi:hypothetical protein
MCKTGNFTIKSSVLGGEIREKNINLLQFLFIYYVKFLSYFINFYMIMCFIGIKN